MTQPQRQQQPNERPPIIDVVQIFSALAAMICIPVGSFIEWGVGGGIISMGVVLFGLVAVLAVV